jgi:hypothetical protein
MFSTPHTLAAGWHNQRHAQCHSRCVLRAGRAVGGGSFFHASTVPLRTDSHNPQTSMDLSTVFWPAEKSGRMSGTHTANRASGLFGAVANVVDTVDRNFK